MGLEYAKTIPISNTGQQKRNLKNEHITKANEQNDFVY